MDYWILMLIVNLSIPLVMIVLGGYFSKHPPEKINWFYGYRTTMSMKSKETWDFAHRHFGKTWLKTGVWMIIPVVLALLFTIGKDKDFTATYGAILCGLQMLVLFGSLFPTETALRKNFDEHGNRRKDKDPAC